MKKQKITKLFAIVSVTAVFGLSVVVSSFAGSKPQANAQSIGDLRSRSAQLQKDIDESHAQAEALEKEADSLRTMIQGLDIQIGQAIKQIELTGLKIQQLEAELVAAQAELERQKGLLRANVKALYKRGDASTVEMIVGSDNFGQYINEQEQLERVKSGIQESANKVIELQKQIEAKRNEQIELKKQQEAQKSALDSVRQQRAQLLADTEGQEAKYRQIVDSLQAKRQQVEKELAAKILAGSFANLGWVEAGQPLARVGMTGFTFGAHLHFELRDGGFDPINPNGAGVWPVPGHNAIHQQYGCSSIRYARTMPGCPSSAPYLHAGLDIGAPVGTPIVAAKAGMIILRSDQGDGYGVKVVVKHNDGTYTLYAHTTR